MQEPSFSYITYGTKCNSQQTEKFITHVIQANDAAVKRGQRGTPICIWGKHGIGKTQLVEEIAQKLGYQFTYIAPAQFEEMGDLTGMPRIVENVDEKNSFETKLIPPDWVPSGEEPGIFLIDDVNRADDRILRGIMQLLQNYELVSWRLPANWHIVLTANPDGGDYSVTPMDNAMITRMLHITMEFDVKSWARWAEAAGVDPRGISFVLTYPELVTGYRTTPRSLVQFFNQIQGLDDLVEQVEMVKMLADASLDEITANSFITFIRMQLSQLITPEEIVDAKEFKSIEGHLEDLVNGKTKRLDILSVISTRLINYLVVNKITLSKSQTDNLVKFIMLELLPNDLRLSIAQDLVKSNNPSLTKLMAVPEIAKLLLRKM
jgi:MoxR-like ATPase